MTAENIKKLTIDIANILYNKKGVDVKVLKVSSKTEIADYFVIAGGNSRTMVNALADEVEFKINEDYGFKPTNIEGRGLGNWILLDYDNVIVHVFNPQSRDFYNLEKLWAECEEVEFAPTEE